MAINRDKILKSAEKLVHKGKIEQAAWDVVETPRFFEVMLKGKHYTTAPILSARICGICSIAHCLTSLEATEDAFGIQVPETARRLRELAKHGETLQSHALHFFHLSSPDLLLGFDSDPATRNIFGVLEQYPDLAALSALLQEGQGRLDFWLHAARGEMPFFQVLPTFGRCCPGTGQTTPCHHGAAPHSQHA